MEVDYLIVGLGISGTMLSWDLLRRGKKIIAFDRFDPYAASRIASGLINPISGIRLVKVNNFETYLPYFERACKELSEEINAPVLTPYSILHFHENQQIKNTFFGKSIQLNKFIKTPGDDETWKQYFHFDEGISQISPCFVIDLAALLDLWRKKLHIDGLLLDEYFDWSNCDASPGQVRHKDIAAKKVICCEGIAAQGNPFFPNLPFTRNKGEAVLVSIPGLARTHIYKKHGLHIIPWKDELFWVGASFEREYADLAPSAQFKNMTMQKLDSWLKVPYSIVDHLAAQRPTTIDRMPFAGCSKEHPSIAIFNGMGAKGCMFAPYFAHCFAEHLLHGSALPPEINIDRFKR